MTSKCVGGPAGVAKLLHLGVKASPSANLPAIERSTPAGEPVLGTVFTPEVKKLCRLQIYRASRLGPVRGWNSFYTRGVKTIPSANLPATQPGAGAS